MAMTNIDQRIEAAVDQAILTAVDEEVKKQVEQAKKNLDRRIPEIVSGITLAVSKHISYERFQNELRVYIKLEDNRT